MYFIASLPLACPYLLPLASSKIRSHRNINSTLLSPPLGGEGGGGRTAACSVRFAGRSARVAHLADGAADVLHVGVLRHLDRLRLGARKGGGERIAAERT
eukprot:5356634-Pleurochrysis_carterae.AAC.1